MAPVAMGLASLGRTHRGTGVPEMTAMPSPETAAEPHNGEKTMKPIARRAAPMAIKAAGSDEALVKHMTQLQDAAAAELIVWLHLSRIGTAERTGKRVQAVAQALADVAKQFNGRLFVLHSGDMVVCCGGVGRHTIDETIELLHCLFDGVPRVPRHARQSNLWSVFDSKADHAALSAALLSVQAEIRARIEARDRASVRPRRKRAINTQPLSTRMRIILLAGLLLACAALFAFAERSQDGAWVFDTPDAQKPHLLRNPWTGDYSR